MGDKDWVKKFYSYGTLIKVTPEQEDLLIQNGPRELYQYRCGNEYDLKNLENGVIWASAVKNFNDPFECDFNLKEFEAYCNEDIIKTSENFADNVNELRKHIALMRDSTVVSCLSEKHDLILMWSHYANKHQGICMCYGVADLLNTRKILVPVWYRNEKITPFEKNNDGTLDLNKRIKEIFIQKASEWSYEEEWRLIELVEESNCDRFKALEKDNGVEIKVVYPERIILGAKVTDELKKEVLRIAKEHSITVTQMKMCDDEFKLIEMNIDV